MRACGTVSSEEHVITEPVVVGAAGEPRNRDRLPGMAFPVDSQPDARPVLTVTTSRDAICPPPAALALNDAAGTEDVSHVQIPGGHVGAVIGEKARTLLYPALESFFRRTACSSIN